MTLTEKLIQFAMNHWILVGGFLLALILLLFEEARSKGMGGNISVDQAVDKMNHEDAIIIDIRDSNSFLDGHIAKARNIPVEQIDQQIGKLSALKERPIIIVYSQGQSAMVVATKFRKAGFEKTQCLAGGMQAWLNASMPVKKK